MGTATEQETGIGYIQRAGKQASILREDVSDTAYGRRGGSLYPLLLLLAAGALVLTALPVVALLPLLLLAIYIGGKR